MKTTVTRLVAILTLALGALAFTLKADAASTFTYGPQPVTAGAVTTFDASALPCSPGPCSYTWQWVFISGNRTVTGGQMGRTPVIDYTFDSFAASKPYVIVRLSVGQGRVGPRQSYQESFKVS